MPTGRQTPQNIFATFTPFEQEVLSTHGLPKQMSRTSTQSSAQKPVNVVPYSESASQWLVRLLNLLTGIVNRNEDLNHVVITKAEYQQLSEVLDDLIYGVGEDESHPLSVVMTLVGMLIKVYEDEDCPKLVDLFPELAENTFVETDSENKNTTAAISGKTDTEFADAFLSIGYLLSETGEDEKAISTYNLAIRIKPDHVPAYMNRGVAKYACGDYRSAIEDHNKEINGY